MKIKLRQIINWVSNIGLTEEQDFSEKLQYRALNLTLAAIDFAFVLMIIFDIIENNETLIYSLLGLVLTTSLLVMQYYNWYFLVRFIFSTLFPFFLFIITVFYGEEMNINYVYFAFFITALLAFERTWLKIVLAIYILVLQIGGIYYNRYYGSLIEKDIPLLDGILILILPTLGVGILILNQVSAIKKLYDQQKKINKELAAKNIALTTAVKQNEAKNNLLSIIAHDLKGPASAFNNLTKNIAFLIKKEEPERLEQMASSFELAGTKLHYIISNLLNWVTSQREHIVSQKNDFDLADLLDEVVDSLSFQNQIKKVNIKYSLEDQPKLSTDRNILKIILFNLLSNAIKFSNTNGEIIVKSSHDSKFDTIEVMDTGPGMEPEIIEKIKGMEIISTPGTHHEKGYGIGLKICFALIRHLEGKIQIESEVGKGSIFRIYVTK